MPVLPDWVSRPVWKTRGGGHIVRRRPYSDVRAKKEGSCSPGHEPSKPGCTVSRFKANEQDGDPQPELVIGPHIENHYSPLGGPV